MYIIPYFLGYIYIYLVGGLKHEIYFPFHIWVVIRNPLTNSYFSRWLLHHQPVYIYIYIYKWRF